MQEKDSQLKTVASSSIPKDLKNAIINERYQIIHQIRQTNTYVAFDHQSEKKYAVQYINYEQMSKDFGQQFKQCFQKMSNIQKNVMQSVNSQKDYVCFCAQAITTKTMKIMVKQYFPGNSLSYKVKKGYIHSQTDAILILKQIIKGYQYLREKKVPILCLQPDDIMQCYGKYKIVNFGLDKLQKIQNLMKENKQVQKAFQTRTFVAPQILKNQLYSSKAYVWNIGMLLLYMLNSRISDKAVKKILNNSQLMEAIAMTKIHVSQQTRNFISKCLEPNPLKRLSWNELISQQIFSSQIMTFTSQALYNEQIKNLDLIDRHYYIQEQKKYLNCLLQAVQIRHTTKYKIENIKTIFSMQAQNQQDLNEKIYGPIANCYLLLLQSHWNYQNLIKFFIFQDIKNKSVVSIKYLLLHRCFTNLSEALKQLSPIAKEGNSLAKSIFDMINTFYKNQIEQQFQTTSFELTNLQNSLKNRVFDWFAKQKDKTNEKFFGGIEKIDFKKEQQIKFTIEYYETNVKNLLVDVKHESMKFLIKNFLSYKEVNFVSYASLKKREKCFYQFVDTLQTNIIDEIQPEDQVRSKISLTDQNDQINHSGVLYKKQQK